MLWLPAWAPRVPAAAAGNTTAALFPAANAVLRGQAGPISAMAQPGTYAVTGKCEAANGYSGPACGSITLLHGGDISGMLTDGPIASGSWDSEDLSFLLVYNGSVPFHYNVRLRTKKASDREGAAAAANTARPPLKLKGKGQWAQDGNPSNRGTIKITMEWQEAVDVSTGAAIPTLAMPLPGTDGNRACEVRPVSALDVPCAMCSEAGGKLSFFDMRVPHFGAAELLSFSCSDCGYKYNKVRTAIGMPLGPKGQTLTLHARTGADLRREVVTSDAATVRLEELDIEVQATGRYTTVEGLVSSIASGLSRAAIASDGSNEDGLVGSLDRRIQALLDSCELSSSELGHGRRGDGETDVGARGFTLVISDPLAMSFISEPPPPLQSSSADHAAEAGIVQVCQPGPPLRSTRTVRTSAQRRLHACM